MITDTVKNLLYIMAVIVGVLMGYPVGHYFGKIDGTTIEKANHTIIAAKQNDAAVAIKEKYENESNTLSNTDLDSKLRTSGWLRD